MVSNYKIEDIKEINELGTTLNPKFTTLFHINNLNHNERIYVYKENNHVIGFLHVSLNYEIADILNIIVKEEKRKQGIASLLFDYMITDLPKNITKILLEVNENNKDAINFYYKFNFKVINIRKKYYGNNSALIMERSLI